jgi:mannose-1-phosphate guanylyltransferase
METCALIMAGGHGTRFWPWSDDLLPKQFLPLAHPTRTLLQQTVDRVAPFCGLDRVLVLTNKEYISIVRSQLPDLKPENIIGEPMIRDTAAAIGLGLGLATRRWPNAVQVVLPADHEIAPDERFRDIINYAAERALKDGKLYTIGIHPSRPSSAYGYLKRARIQESDRGFLCSAVASFVEKPDESTAQEYVDSGIYYWNAGIFIWTPEALRGALRRQLPVHADMLPQVSSAASEPDFVERLNQIFLKLDKISIDYGMMQGEGALGNVRMVEGDFHWNDLGGWETFSVKLPRDSHGNRVYGHAHDWTGENWTERYAPRQPDPTNLDEDLSLGDVFTMNARNNLVFNNRDGHRTVLYEVNDLAVIHTQKATLVAPRSLIEAIKPLVSALPVNDTQGGTVTPQRIEKPWGWELWWGKTRDFVGKTLFLKKDKRFSLQYHVIKEEVIFVQSGKVRLWTAPRGGELVESTLNAGDALHVEPGRLHRMMALEDSMLLEVSTSFLWDVVRVADDFGREGTRNVTDTDE